MSANNHRGQEVKNFHKQAGYMRAMISSHIKDQMSCKPEWVHICRWYESTDGRGRTKQEPESRAMQEQLPKDAVALPRFATPKRVILDSRAAGHELIRRSLSIQRNS